MKRKEQVLVVPVTYLSHIENGFTGVNISTESSYTLYDSIGVYKPLYEIEKKICFIRISVFLLIENENGDFLLKELKDKNAKPRYELGLHSYIKSYSGNYKAILNQINDLSNKSFHHINNYKFIGNIRDLANSSVKSILGCIYHCKTNTSNFIKTDDNYNYVWCNKQELIDRYGRATSWSRIIIDMIVDKSINEYL